MRGRHGKCRAGAKVPDGARQRGDDVARSKQRGRQAAARPGGHSLCVRAIQRAIAYYGAPEIVNTDQGCQFTSAEFTQPLLAAGIKLSMDGKGRCLDDVFVERLWRTLKYEEVYLKSYRSQVEAETNLAVFFRFYNEQRPHSVHARDGRHFTPMEVYHRDLPVALSA